MASSTRSNPSSYNNNCWYNKWWGEIQIPVHSDIRCSLCIIWTIKKWLHKIIFPKLIIRCTKSRYNYFASYRFASHHIFCNCENEMRTTKPESEFEYFANKGFNCLFGLKPKKSLLFLSHLNDFQLTMISWSCRRLAISYSIMSFGREDMWTVLIGEQQYW